jgi:uncharacterized protein YjbI with pentapeptide repeats
MDLGPGCPLTKLTNGRSDVKIFNNEELKEIIRKHYLWVNDEDGGQRANLEEANLRGANLRVAPEIEAK